MPDRPGPIRVTLFIMAAFALIIGAAAFVVAIQANSHNAQVAIAAAKRAATEARVAAAHAEAAHRQAEVAIDDLCTFLNGVRHSHQDSAHPDEARERIDAQRLWIAYGCGR